MSDGLSGVSALTAGGADVKVWGMTSGARLSRTYSRLGLTEGVAQTGATVVLSGAHVFDEAVVRALAARPGVVVVDAEGAAAAAHVPAKDAEATAAALVTGASVAGERLNATALAGAYNAALRKREPPILERLTADTVRAVEKRLFQGSYKGVTDLVTKHVWPAPARVVTRWCALAGITPNQVTFASLILVLVTMGLFWIGEFGWGLVCAWAMTFLDTVDGKLARVTLNASPLGNVFDHGIDLIHPPFWWWAWVVGVQAAGPPLWQPALVLGVIVGGYVVQRILEGAFLGAFKVEMHAWRPFDSWFRQITARRNPNLILLTAATLFGRPDLGILAVAIWTAASLLVHLIQIVQAAVSPRGSITSWLAR